MTTSTWASPRVAAVLLAVIVSLSAAVMAADLAASPGQVEQPQGAVIKARVFLVNLFVTALDDDRYVRDLMEQDFQIYEDGEPQPIKYFNNLSESQDLPLTIIMLIDTSGSVVDKLQQEIATASAFLKHILRKNKDLAAVIGFHSEVELLQDFTDDPSRLDGALSRLRPGGNTSLYDAIYLASEDMLQGEAGRKIIVVLSDGADTSSRVRQEEAIKAAQKNDVLIYGLGVRSPRFQSDFRALKKFTEETGGKFFSIKASIKTLRDTFDQIMTDMHHQYNIAYEPRNQARNGEYREIKIKVKGRRLDLYYRNGYFAPED
jgi:VWFA-related protein